jgi:aspartyl-tRNA(Asn)/glutamyl-tRNA(Gln) amidotransferase subunit C
MEIKDVEKLAELAKIDLTAEEKVKLLSDMKEILDYVKQIESAEVSDVKINDTNKNVWREDQLASRVFSRDLIIKQFPDSQDGFLKVKKIL